MCCELLFALVTLEKCVRHTARIQEQDFVKECGRNSITEAVQSYRRVIAAMLTGKNNLNKTDVNVSKVKLSLCLTKNHAVKMYGGVEV
jgi:hypothetical protein